MSKEYLGEFEELVLTMVGILQDEAYGNSIVNEIKDRVGRESNLSAVHVTLYRLEDKGLVRSSMVAPPTPVVAGAKGFFKSPMQGWPCFAR